jgi:hypothetical protein
MAEFTDQHVEHGSASFLSSGVLLVEKYDSHKEITMRRYFLSAAASLVTLVGLAGAPSVARADHHEGHHHGWHHEHPNWHHEGYRWRGYYTPYPSYYAVPYSSYSYPYYAPYQTYVYPSYGLGYQGPYFSFWLGR